MGLQLLVAFALTSGTVVIHALGTLAAIAHLTRIWQKNKNTGGRFTSELQIVRVVSILLLLHLAESAIWACAYRLLEILPDIETAIYFSLTSYTTVGYGDVVLPAPWRLLGPMEAGVGILMFGWSTGIMVAVISNVYRERFRTGSMAGIEPKVR